MIQFFDLFTYRRATSFAFNRRLSKVPKDKFPTKSSESVKKIKFENFSYLKNFWSRLIFAPKSYHKYPNAYISNIVAEETGPLATEIIRSTLSTTLNLPLNSAILTEAISQTSSIFHEDFPFDFILEYKGERLGMMVLDFCYNSNNQAIPEYKFNPHVKSFKGVF